MAKGGAKKKKEEEETANHKNPVLVANNFVAERVTREKGVAASARDTSSNDSKDGEKSIDCSAIIFSW